MRQRTDRAGRKERGSGEFGRADTEAMRGRRDARQCRRRLAGREARQEGSASRRRGRSPMAVKRYFRGPFVAVIVVLRRSCFLDRYANSRPTHKSENTSRVSQLIETGQARSAKLTDTNPTIP